MNSLAPKETPSQAEDPSADLRPLVLLIDDDAGLRDSLTMVMEAFGFRIATAEDGEAGLKAVATERPAVIVTDLHMPALDGFGVMNALRRSGIDIPTIVISGGSSPKREDALLRCAEHFGAVATFEKPFSPLDLMDAINNLPAYSGTKH